MSKRNISILILGLFIGFCGGICNFTNVFAYDLTAINKINVLGLKRCFAALKAEVKARDIQDYISFGHRDNENAQTGLFVSKNEALDKKVPMPNSTITVFNGSSDGSPLISCRDLLFGNGSDWGGIVNLQSYDDGQGENGYPSYTAVAAFLEKLGYKINSSNKKCFKVQITYAGNDDPDAQARYNPSGGEKVYYDSNTICAEARGVDMPFLGVSAEAVKVSHLEASDATTAGRYGLVFFVEKDYFAICGSRCEIEDGVKSLWVNTSLNVAPDYSQEVIADISFSFKKRDGSSAFMEWEEVKNKFYTALDNAIGGYSDTGGYELRIVDVDPVGEQEGSAVYTPDSVFEKGNLEETTLAIVGTLSENFSSVEAYNYYANYLSNVNYVSMNCSDDAPGTSWMPVKVKVEGELKQCYVIDSGYGRLYTGVSTLNNNALKFEETNLSLSEIVRQINEEFDFEAHFDEIDDVVPNAVPDDSESYSGGGYGGGGATSDPCHDSSGALGWVICPILTKLADAATLLYENIIQPFLVVNPTLVSRDSGTYVAWSVMLGIANVVLIIYFLVIIFSQLTGVGIDNYGIKKSLPKIIVVAILINLSFLVCQLLVDLSNILGDSLGKLLSEINVSASNGVEFGNMGGAWFKYLINAASLGLLGVGIVTIVSGLMSDSGGGVLSGVIIPFLLMLMVVLIGIIFFFILLGIRKAGVVLLVVLAPVAFSCYMLPNMKQYFDKWKKAFQGLLLVYPICGLLIGGGQLVSKLILTVSTDYMMFFTGCILMVAPFFFIPTLLKGSMRAMGNIGAMVSGFGNKLGSKSRNRLDSGIKGIRNNQFNKDRRAIRQADRMQKSVNKKLAKGKGVSMRRRTRLANAMKERNAAVDREGQAAAGIAAASLGESWQEHMNERIKQEEKNSVGVVAVNRDNVRTELKNERVKQEEKNAVGVVAVSRDNIRRDLENEKMKAEVEIEVGPKPLLNRNNLRTRLQNTINEATADNNVDVLPVNVQLATERRQAARDVQELKSYSDRYGNLTRTEMSTQLDSAVNNYQSNRGDRAAMLSLRAAIREAERRGMNKEMLNGQLGGLVLTAGQAGTGDSEILDELAGSRDIVMNQYGKQLSKNGGTSLSMDGFARGSNGAVNLSSSLGAIGVNALHSANDDTLEYINEHRNQAGQIAATGDMLLSKAKSTSSDKELTQVNKMLAGDQVKGYAGVDPDSLHLAGGDFGSLETSTLNTLSNIASNNTGFRDEFVKASNDLAKSPDLVNNLRSDKMKVVNDVRKMSDSNDPGVSAYAQKQAADAQSAAQAALQSSLKNAMNDRVIEVRQYVPKIQIGNNAPTPINVRVMGDGRLVDENGNDFSKKLGTHNKV